VGSFHTRLVVRFMIFTASVRNILDTHFVCNFYNTFSNPVYRASLDVMVFDEHWNWKMWKEVGVVHCKLFE
jgi:hypothetical protein